jgi:hypothetical protein
MGYSCMRQIRVRPDLRTCGFAGLFPILVTALLLTGCGKKMFPQPVTEGPPPQVRDLEATVSSKGVELSWSVPAEMTKGLPYRFAVWKTELNWENRNCLDCPAPTQQEVARVDPARPEPASAQDGKLVWIDTLVSKHHAYRYQVAIQEREKRAVPISLSNPAVAKVVPAPQPPTDLQAVTQQHGILLHWKESRKDVNGRKLEGEVEFLVERHVPNEQWEKASPVLIKGTSYLDKLVTSHKAYDYRVTPILQFEGSSVVGEPAAVGQAKAPGAIPPPPPKSVWVIPTKGAVEIQWTKSEAAAVAYHIYRKEGKEITRLTSTPVAGPPYVDRSVKKNTLYYYAVSAINTQSDQAEEGLLSKWVEFRSVLSE